MRGLTIIVAGCDPDRFRAALAIAAAQAALGGRVQLYFHEEAVALLAARSDPADANRHDRGLGTRAELIGTALDLGVKLIVCQTGLAANNLDLTRLPPGVEAGGLVSLLASASKDRLILA